MPHHIRIMGWVFISGLALMALELLGSRLLAPAFGNSIFVWGSLIGVVLSALCAGYLLGGTLADRCPSYVGVCSAISAAGILVMALPSLTYPICNAVINLNLGERYSPLLAATVLLAPPSVLLGMVPPYSIRVTAKSFKQLGKSSGALYALSTLGSLVGTFLTVFILIPAFGVSRVILALGVTLLVSAFLGLNMRLKVLVLLILALAPLAAPNIVNHTLALATNNTQSTGVVYEADTPYQHVLVTDMNDSAHSTFIRFLITDGVLQSAMDLKDPHAAVFAYTDYFHIGFLVNANIERVLFVGGGGFTGPKEFLRDYPSVRVDVVEIDPAIIKISQRYFGLDVSNPRLRIYVEDARLFLRGTDQKYDLIILDALSSGFIPFHLMTKEFFEELVNHLGSNGTVISNLISPPHGAGAQLLRDEAKTLRSVFPNVYAFAVEGPESQGLQNIILLATLRSQFMTKGDFKEVAKNVSSLKTRTLGQAVANYFVPETEPATVLTDDFAPVETQISPLVMQPLGNYQDSDMILKETMRILAIAVLISVVIVICRAKRVVQRGLHKNTSNVYNTDAAH